MKELHTVPTGLGYAIISIDPEAKTVEWIEPKKLYTTRQAAHRRREQLKESNTMDRYNDPMTNPNYCGYCKSEPCQCFDEETGQFNDTSIHYHPCGYCYLDPCECDGFGGPVTDDKDRK